MYDLDYKIISFHVLAGFSSMPLIISCFPPRFHLYIHSATSWMSKCMVFTGSPEDFPEFCSQGIKLAVLPSMKKNNK
jgi:hypothetical protein